MAKNKQRAITRSVIRTTIVVDIPVSNADQYKMLNDYLTGKSSEWCDQSVEEKIDAHVFEYMDVDVKSVKTKLVDTVDIIKEEAEVE